ncbi:hypothetical protein FB45DRAFT_922902 [Roridomyces roridus]|uniref:F-box domain-containing protein n=1 Tax=Roridomyces roridus TaxID=1738132 RepID=A0AAD7FIH3_9AGAR|nr:hypothetical protein FB45DRAFT_922902 [Roridomyces roridus]
MVLTRRARKCILRWLPNELVSEIIALSSSDTQRALCRVCKPFYQLAVISLYRAVDLGSYSKFARFAESLSSTPGNAIHVVSLRLHTTSRESEEDVAEFSVKCSLLNSLSRLKSLSISVSLGETICAGLLRDCTFPSLSDFRYIAPGSLKTTGMLTDEIVFSFIHRHREITRVVVMDASPRAPGSISREPNDSPLQNLRQFVGPDYLLDLLPPGITQIFLFSGDEEQTNALQRLSRLTAQGTDLNYSSIIILREPMARRLSLIARHLPRLVSLQLRWGTSPGRWLEPVRHARISPIRVPDSTRSKAWKPSLKVLETSPPCAFSLSIISRSSAFWKTAMICPWTSILQIGRRWRSGEPAVRRFANAVFTETDGGVKTRKRVRQSGYRAWMRR